MLRGGSGGRDGVEVERLVHGAEAVEGGFEGLYRRRLASYPGIRMY
jgi:hypothetical protein